MVDGGADVDKRNKLNNTAADSASRNNKDEVYSYLVGKSWFEQQWTDPLEMLRTETCPLDE